MTAAIHFLKRRVGVIVLSLTSALSLAVSAQVPHMIDYQGRIAVRGALFTGIGQFKFALVNGDGTEVFWSHDGTGTPATPPASIISLDVQRGYYSTRLGDTSITNMTELAPSVFEHPDMRVRVWFNDGHSGLQLLAPDRRISSVAYAVIADTVADEAITSEKLAPGAVTFDKLAPDTSDRLLGAISTHGLLASFDAEDVTLTQLGYAPVLTFPAKPWLAGPEAALSPRTRHSVVWAASSSSMIVWGGQVGEALSNQGAGFSETTGTWTPLPLNAFSPPRADHTAVWGSDRMIVWGGMTSAGLSKTGAVYHPATRSWVATPTTGAPDERNNHTAIWAGSRMLVWGGGNGGGLLNTGAMYTPPVGGYAPDDSGSWAAIPTDAAPSPRRYHSAVWAGNRMIIWGGQEADGSPLSDGGVFDPHAGIWSPVNAAGAPTARMGHSAIWTGSEMVVFGGSSRSIPARATLHGDGGIYDPITDTWSPLPASTLDIARAFHQAIWLGEEMLLLGGQGSTDTANASLAAYRPVKAKWRTLPHLPKKMSAPTGVWSGNALLLFEGNQLWTLEPTAPLTLYGKF